MPRRYQQYFYFKICLNFFQSFTFTPIADPTPSIGSFQLSVKKQSKSKQNKYIKKNVNFVKERKKSRSFQCFPR